MTIAPFKRADLVATYEAARRARRAYEAAKAKHAGRDDAGIRAWQRGWRDEGRAIHPWLCQHSETTP